MSPLKISPDERLARYRQLSPSASVRVSPLCLGTMTFGDKQQDKYGATSKEDVFAVLDEFYSRGGNFIDTSNAYQNGQSEEWIGEWMRMRGNRHDLVIATKYSSSSSLNNPHCLQINRIGNGTKSMRLAFEESLQRLQTSFVDVFYLHWWDFTASVEEVMLALNDLVSAGKVNYLGISDTPAWIVTKANQYARMNGLRQFVVYQGMWNAAMRDFERDIIPMCISEGMALAPYGVLNQGRFQSEEGWKRREKANNGRNFVQTTARDKHVSKVLEGLARAKGVDLLHIALSYVRQKAAFVFPIVGARNVGHIRGSIEGLNVGLTEDDLQIVDGAYDFDHGFPHTFLSGTMFHGGRAAGAFEPRDVWLTKQGGNEIEWVSGPKAIEPRVK